MWFLEKEKVWDALNYLIDKVKDSIRRDDELLKIIQEDRHKIFDLEQDIEILKEQLNIKGQYDLARTKRRS